MIEESHFEGLTNPFIGRRSQSVRDVGQDVWRSRSLAETRRSQLRAARWFGLFHLLCVCVFFRSSNTRKEPDSDDL